MGYAIIFLANVAISNPSELIERRRCRLVFLIDQRLSERDNSYAEILRYFIKNKRYFIHYTLLNYMVFNIFMNVLRLSVQAVIPYKNMNMK